MAMRPGKRKALPDTPDGRLRAHRTGQGQHPGQAEHPFRIIKNLFGMKKVSWAWTGEEHSAAVTVFLWAGESVDWQILERSKAPKMREETKCQEFAVR